MDAGMKFPWLIVVALLGALAVIFGAIGAHIVHGDEAATGYQKTALNYHMFGLVPILLADILIRRNPAQSLFANLSALLCTIGVLMFSGSLYYLAWSGGSVGYNITPTGGVLMIAGWICLVGPAFSDFRRNR
jgi:uncharacterized membrane protein YgdD (TMEM256/DUF423 family)